MTYIKNLEILLMNLWYFKIFEKVKTINNYLLVKIRPCSIFYGKNWHV